MKSREKRGQFVIIAIMLTAIMIVSIAALMHGAITYYKHEPWEEYSTLIGDIEINSRKIVELCLASYTNSLGGDSILSDTLTKWQNDLTIIYPSSGIRLTSSGYQLIQGSNPTAKADFTLNINSIGLKGYTFSVKPSLSLEASQNSSVTPYNIAAIVKSESGEPVTGLGVSDFKINGNAPTAVSPFYDEFETLVYRIQFQGTFPAKIEVWDHRGICAYITV